MSKVTSISQPHLLSISAAARAWGTSRDVVRARLHEAEVEPAGTRGGYPAYDLKDVVSAMTVAGQSDPDRLKPFERKAYYQAEHEKLRLEVERGELASRLEVEQEFTRFFEVVGRTLDVFPDRMERSGVATPTQLRFWDEEMDKMREELYEEIVSGAERPAAESG